MVSEASENLVEPFSISDIIVSIKCGSSDTTSRIASNPAVTSRIASNPAVGAAVNKIIDETEP